MSASNRLLRPDAAAPVSIAHTLRSARRARAPRSRSLALERWARICAALLTFWGCAQRPEMRLEGELASALAADSMPFLSEEGFPEVPRRKVELMGEMRNALVLPATHRIETEFRVPRNALLELAFGVWTRDAASAPKVRFETILRDATGTSHVLLSRELNPSQGVDERRWIPGRFDLGSYAGQSVTLTFAASGEGGASDESDDSSGSAYALWAHPRILLPPAVRRPNVVLISLDTLRADHLGCYGYERDTSPYIDAWSRGGARFAHATVQAPWTTPSHVSLLTSLHPSTHHVNESILSVKQFLETGAGAIRSLPTEAVTLADVLRRAGYRTAGFTGGATVDAAFGFAQGFDVYGDPLPKLTDGSFSLVEEWITNNHDRPFFLFFHTFEVHAPYSRSSFAGPEGADLVERLSGSPPADPVDVRERLEEEGLGPAFTMALYDSGIHHADRYVGKLLALLEELGVSDETLVILTSDHGEEFGDHHPDHYYDAHGYSVFEENVRVPLIMSLPSRVPAGSVLEPVVRTIDVMPTILDLLELNPPGGLQGRSLLPLMRGETWSPMPALTEGALGPRESVSIRTQDYKYVVFMPGPTGLDHALPLTPAEIIEQLYDLEHDPMERTDISRNHPELVQQFRARLEAALASLREQRHFLATRGKVDDSLMERLESLGYVQGE